VLALPLKAGLRQTGLQALTLKLLLSLALVRKRFALVVLLGLESVARLLVNAGDADEEDT
jgi:hypothetical protein